MSKLSDAQQRFDTAQAEKAAADADFLTCECSRRGNASPQARWEWEQALAAAKARKAAAEMALNTARACFSEVQTQVGKLQSELTQAEARTYLIIRGERGGVETRTDPKAAALELLHKRIAELTE